MKEDVLLTLSFVKEFILVEFAKKFSVMAEKFLI